MADTKIGDASTIASLATGDAFPVFDASAATAINKATVDQVKTFVNTAPVWAAGSASASSWPILTSGTLLTTAEDGAFEHDTNCFYLTTDAGNRGYVPVRHFIRCDSARTLPNDTALNAIFDSPTNGRITLETGTYIFESLIIVAGMSATSGNALINLIGAGTATVAAWLWMLQGIDAATVGTLVDLDGPFFQTNVTAASAVTAGTGATLRLWMKGTFEVTGAGTFIPSIDQVTAAAATVQIGSYFMLERIGSTTVASVGQWD